MPEHQEQCIKAIFSGHVQGVGFRYTVKELASGYSVTGHVRNLADGTVELIAHGSVSEVDEFIKAIKLAMHRYLLTTHIAPHDDNGPLGFKILG